MNSFLKLEDITSLTGSRNVGQQANTLAICTRRLNNYFNLFHGIVSLIVGNFGPLYFFTYLELFQKLLQVP